MNPVIEVPFLDLKAQYHAIKEEIDEAVHRVLKSQHFILGPEVESLENELARYCQCKYAVGVSSGTDALLVSLMALGIGLGDEVITTPYTFFATVGTIHRVGAVPVFVDIDPQTYNVDPLGIEKAVTKRTKAIIPVHLFGQCADMDPILDVAKRKGLFVIEDAAQAIGAEYKGRRAGSMGTTGCFSFFPSKNLGGIGDGGMVTTNDQGLAGLIRTLRVHGSKPKYYNKVIGGNFRLDSINAAALRAKLRHLDEWTTKRREIAARYDKLMIENGLAEKYVGLPVVKADRHIFNQYVIRTRDREGLLKALKKAGIGAEVYYPLPVHLQECFASLGYKEGAFPHSEEAARSTLALPSYPELTREQQDYVAGAIHDFYSA